MLIAVQEAHLHSPEETHDPKRKRVRGIPTPEWGYPGKNQSPLTAKGPARQRLVIVSGNHMPIRLWPVEQGTGVPYPDGSLLTLTMPRKARAAEL